VSIKLTFSSANTASPTKNSSLTTTATCRFNTTPKPHGRSIIPNISPSKSTAPPAKNSYASPAWVPPASTAFSSYVTITNSTPSKNSNSSAQTPSAPSPLSSSTANTPPTNYPSSAHNLRSPLRNPINNNSEKKSTAEHAEPAEDF